MGEAELGAFADEVGRSDEVTITGQGTRGGAVPDVRAVTAPAGIEAVDPEEMTVRCGAATAVDELTAELGRHGQTVVLPPGGTVGGALAVGASGIRRLGDGPVRDAVLQVRYVSAAGEIVKAGGPTVKNVSGFDLCRLLVGSVGTLGFLGEVILRTRAVARWSQWFVADADPRSLLATLYRPTSILWDGARTWVLLEGHEGDRHSEALGAGLRACDGPPDLPTGGRRSLPPARLFEVERSEFGDFVAEVGVGIVHTSLPTPAVTAPPAVRQLHERIKAAFDPTGRMNPGRSPIAR